MLGTGILGGCTSAQSQQANVLGPSAVPVQLTINGQRRSLNVEPRVTLLDALRTGWI